MSAALSLLREKGLLDYSRGKRIRVTAALSPRGTSFESFAGDIRRRIAEGIYRVGQPLPKASYFVITGHLSKSTVCDALKQLAEENLIHKKGKAWLVGPAPGRRTAASSARASAPVVLVLVPGYDTWRSLLGIHMRPFAYSFLAELERHGFQYVLVQAYDTDGKRRLVPAGKRAILDTVNALGARYAGALAVHAHHREEFAGLQDWLAWISRFDRPVVWFDFAGMHPEFDRKRIPRRNYYRCFTDQQELVRIVLRHLHEAGHRNVLLPLCLRQAREGWTAGRIALIEKVRQSEFSGMRVDLVESNEDIWLRGMGSFLEDDDAVICDFAYETEQDIIAAATGMSPAARLNRLRARLRAALPSLDRLLADTDHTAIIALNQWFAINLRYWFGIIGEPLPRRFSLITFDNYSFYARHPVTTVDMNFDDLGYRAAHLMIGDVPVRADRRGNVPNRPRLVDRGSVLSRAGRSAGHVSNGSHSAPI
ncbi:MAG: GntR family transcriptional regulator [Chitinivibrionales bacterium]|nr:GntR family transcriptional regulator [Chitinivibrionales bacterium]MBD3394310.1 GntR family transcriptional regulator [Chitinivibrionales bacterium]